MSAVSDCPRAATDRTVLLLTQPWSKTVIMLTQVGRTKLESQFVYYPTQTSRHCKNKLKTRTLKS